MYDQFTPKIASIGKVKRRHCRDPHLTHAISPEAEREGGIKGAAEAGTEGIKGRISGLFTGLAATSYFPTQQPPAVDLSNSMIIKH